MHSSQSGWISWNADPIGSRMFVSSQIRKFWMRCADSPISAGEAVWLAAVNSGYLVKNAAELYDISAELKVSSSV